MSFEVYSESDIVYLEIGGVPVAIDAIIEVYINGVLYASLAAMPVHLREVALGLLVGDGLINSLDEVEGISVDGRKLEVKTKIDLPATRRSYDEDCSAIAPPRIRRVNSTLKVDWNTIRSVFLDFNKRTASISKGLSVHSTGIYDVLHRRAVIAHDVSRHTAVLKAIGLALEVGIPVSSSIVITTGRASADMVYRAANAEAPILVTMRGPLNSGLRAAVKTGVTLIANLRRVKEPGLKILANAQRINH